MIVNVITVAVVQKPVQFDSWVNHSGYIVSFGGLFGNRIHKGEEIIPIIYDKETLFRVIDAAVSFFKEQRKRWRKIQITIERIGEDKFRKVIEEAYNG